MIRNILFLLLITSLVSCRTRNKEVTARLSGNSTGNGGGGWVCRDSYGKILWSELIDLFEAQNSYDLVLGHFNGSSVDMANAAIEKMTYRNPEWTYPQGWFEKMEEVNQWLSKTGYLEEGAKNVVFTDEKLDVINDALYFSIPSQDTCKNGQLRYEQIVDYLKDGRILVQRELFQSLSEISRAALIVHESIYAWQRSEGARDSVNTREIVGRLFSNWSDMAFVAELLGLYSEYDMPFMPGKYDVSMMLFDSSGSRTPIANQQISFQMSLCLGNSVNRICGPPEHNVLGTTDEIGKFTADLGGFSNGSWAPGLQFNLHGHSFSGALQLNGWAMQLQSESSSYSTLWCETLISERAEAFRPGKIRINCAERK